MPGHLFDKTLDIVTNEKEFLLIVLIGGVDGQFGRRQAKYEPTLAGVNMGEFEHIPQEGTIGGGIGAVDNRMRSGDHFSYQMYGTRR